MTGFGMRPPDEALRWQVVEKPFDPQALTSLLVRIARNEAAVLSQQSGVSASAD